MSNNMKKVILLSVIMFLCFHVFSQKQSVSLSGMFYKTGIQSSSFTYNGDLTSKSGNNWSLHYEYSFKNPFGFLIGIGYATYAGQYGMKVLNTEYNGLDSENSNVIYKITGNNFVENQTINAVNIPLGLVFESKIKNDLSVYGQTGLVASYFIKHDYGVSGIYNTQGYYPDYHVTIYGIPEYGYTENAPLVSTGEINTKPLVLGLFANFGLRYVIKRYSVFAGLSFLKTGNIMNSPTLDNKESWRYTGAWQSSSKINLQNVGFQIGCSYVFNEKKVVKKVEPNNTTNQTTAVVTKEEYDKQIAKHTAEISQKNAEIENWKKEVDRLNKQISAGNPDADNAKKAIEALYQDLNRIVNELILNPDWKQYTNAAKYKNLCQIFISNNQKIIESNALIASLNNYEAVGKAIEKSVEILNNKYDKVTCEAAINQLTACKPQASLVSIVNSQKSILQSYESVHKQCKAKVFDADGYKEVNKPKARGILDDAIDLATNYPYLLEELKKKKNNLEYSPKL